MTKTETVEELYRCVRDSDYSGFVSLCAADVTWIQNPGFPNGGVRRGAQNVVDEIFKAFAKDWTSWKFRIERIVTAGDEVLVIGFYEAVHARTKKQMQAEAAHLFSFSGDKIVQFRQFADTKIVHDAMS